MIKNTPQLTKYFLALADDDGKNGEPKKYCFMLFFRTNFFPCCCCYCLMPSHICIHMTISSSEMEERHGI